MKNSANKSEKNVSTINKEMLAQLNKIGITDAIKEKGTSKSIFKKEFNNKTDRTSCRTKFINGVQMYLIHLAHNKVELASAKLKEIKDVAKKYYLSEDKFADASDYCSSNMEENKREAIKLFISLQTPKEEKEKKARTPRVKKEKEIIIIPESVENI